MNFEIIKLDQKAEWVSCVKQCHSYDFYHTWHYHSTEKVNEPLLFVYREKDAFVAIPLLKRPIAGTNMFDLTSVYGYAGPISNKKFTMLDAVFLNNLKISFLAYMRKERIISLFSRLHPLIDQSPFLDRFGGCDNTGKTVFIDLDKPIDIQRSYYRKGHLDNITSLRSKNISFKDAISDQEIELFADIYTENMRRINASEEYIFNSEYFHNFVNATEFQSRLMFICLDDVPIAGGVFTFSNQIIQVHLLATRTEYLHDSPTKTLVDEISIIGRELGMRYLHLGGGFGGKNDSLFYWKSGFSPTFLTFQTWRIIADLVAYNQLVYDVIPEHVIRKAKNDFFPLYRTAI